MVLPIVEVKQQVLADFDHGQPWRMLVSAPTGSGKSTGLPCMILEGVCEPDGMIVVVQPRRLAARMLAKRVAEVRGAAIGGEVGYAVRYDHKMTKQTKIVYVTDGILQRWLQDNPNLKGIAAVIFDEFHERRIAMDVALADCLNLQDGKRPELKVVVMSATLEVAGLEDYLTPCRKIEAGGRAFPVEIEYQKIAKQSARRVGRGNNEEPVWDKCIRALKEVVADPECGNILIFMPGVYEIRRTMSAIENLSLNGWEICPLYGALKPEMQDRAVSEKGGKRIIVSTNVAETSLTIPRVRTVIDAGLARIAQFDSVRGMDTLFVIKIARSAADQRSGRAGRVAPGKCIRLWTETDHSRREAFELPEVSRVDLTDVVLQLKSRGFTEIEEFRWLDSPSDESSAHALDLLENIGALEENTVSDVGRQLAKIPLHPRMAKLMLSAHQEGCLAEGVFAATLIEGESLFLRSGDSAGRSAFIYGGDGSDFCADSRGYISAQAMGFQPNRCNTIGVSARAARELQKGIESLTNNLKRFDWIAGELDFEKNSGAFSRAILSAYSDQLAVRNNRGNLSCRIVGGRSGQLNSESAVKEADLLIATSMTEVGARDVVVYLNGCVEVSLADIRSFFPHDLLEKDGAYYDETIRRVVNRQELKFRDLVISTKEGGQPSSEEAATLLAERVASGELKLKKWDASVEQWIARLLCLREWMPELELPGFDEEDRAIALQAVCEGALGYKQIKDKAVQPALNNWLSAGQHASLDAYAPERMTLANGKSVKVKYEHGKPPHIALTVQRLYGVNSSPMVAQSSSGAAVTVQIHICAPNQRPWQMTQDLASFWKSGFSQMKKDLAGRYPKHDWSGGGHVMG